MSLGVAALAALSGCGGDDSGDDNTFSVATPAPDAKEIEACLREAGVRAKATTAPAGDDDVPDYELGFQHGTAPDGGGLLALYESEDEAERLLPSVQENSEGFGGLVEHDGSITAVWVVDPPDPDARADVLGCLS